VANDTPAANIGAVLMQHAREVSDRRLVVDIALGTAGVIAIVLLRADLWLLSLPFVTLMAFGAWGVADRSATATNARWLGMAKHGAELIGFGAALLFALGVMAVVLGNWLH
jgi:hypothetical protein